MQCGIFLRFIVSCVILCVLFACSNSNISNSNNWQSSSCAAASPNWQSDDNAEAANNWHSSDSAAASSSWQTNNNQQSNTAQQNRWQNFQSTNQQTPATPATPSNELSLDQIPTPPAVPTATNSIQLPSASWWTMPPQNRSDLLSRDQLNNSSMFKKFKQVLDRQPGQECPELSVFISPEASTGVKEFPIAVDHTARPRNQCSHDNAEVLHAWVNKWIKYAESQIGVGNIIQVEDVLGNAAHFWSRTFIDTNTALKACNAKSEDIISAIRNYRATEQPVWDIFVFPMPSASLGSLPAHLQNAHWTEVGGIQVLRWPNSTRRVARYLHQHTSWRDK